MPDPNIPDYWFLDPVLIFAAIVGFGIVMLVGMLIQRMEARQQRAYRDRKKALQDGTRVSATDRPAAPPTPTLRGPTQDEPAVRVEVQEEDQVVLVGAEIMAAGNFIRTGVALLRSHRSAQDCEPALTLLALGVEKTTRVLLATFHEHRTGSWPSAATIRSWGSGPVELNDRMVAALLEERADPASQYEAEVLRSGGLEAPDWRTVVALLNPFGLSTGSSVLETVSTGNPEDEEAPIYQFFDYLDDLLRAHPEIQEVRDADFAEGTRQVLEIISASVIAWRDWLHRLGMWGRFGQHEPLIAGRLLAPFE